MTRIERIHADFTPSCPPWFIRADPHESDLIRARLPLFFLSASGFAGLGYT
jgi:hypothetical protein